MRQGELLGLRWSDVSDDLTVLQVRHSLQRGTRELAETKTEQSRRAVKLPQFAVDALRRHRARQNERRLAVGPRKWRNLDLVFSADHGQPLDGVNVTHRLQDALERAGLPRQRFHDLRHAYATLSRQAGISMSVISQSLGHSNYSTISDIYSHLMAPEQVEAADRLDRLIGVQREAASG